MKKVLSILLAVAFCAAAAAPWGARAQGKSNAGGLHTGKLRKVENSIPGQYIVVLKDDGPASDVAATAEALAGAHGGAVKRAFRHALKGFSVSMSEQAAEALSRSPLVDYVEEDGIVTATDTQFSPTWGRDRIDQRD